MSFHNDAVIGEYVLEQYLQSGLSTRVQQKRIRARSIRPERGYASNGYMFFRTLRELVSSLTETSGKGNDQPEILVTGVQVRDVLLPSFEADQVLVELQEDLLQGELDGCKFEGRF